MLAANGLDAGEQENHKRQTKPIQFIHTVNADKRRVCDLAATQTSPEIGPRRGQLKENRKKAA